jgi:hypothetical protein
VADHEHRKKIVLLTRDGMHHIVGAFDPSVHTVRDYIEFEMIRDQKVEQVGASLIAVKPRFIFYRETMHQALTGRLGEFHPQQK